jgi:predicted alpha/beta hydrolase family esterase
MVKRILFVQGAGEGVHDLWDSNLVASLEHELGEGYAVCYPRMPREDDPDCPAWKAALARQFASLEDGAFLVGHSFGGTVLIQALAGPTPKPRFGGLFVVAAPFIGEGGWAGDDIGGCEDVSGRLALGLPVFLYHGADDTVVPEAHVHLHARALGHAVVRTLERRDHQLDNDMSEVARDIRSMG